MSPSHHWRSSAVPDSSCKITSDQCLSPWISGLLVGSHRGIISHRGGAGELTDICLQSAEVKYIHHQPSSLANLLHSYNPSRSLRSFDQYLLTVPRTRFLISDRSFDGAAPITWNSLTLYLRTLFPPSTFRSSLKTYLFDHPVTKIS